MRSRVPSATGLVLAFWSLYAWCAPPADLLAPVYRAAEHAPEYDSGRSEALVSKDPPAEVSAWYRSRLEKALEGVTATTTGFQSSHSGR